MKYFFNNKSFQKALLAGSLLSLSSHYLSSPSHSLPSPIPNPNPSIPSLASSIPCRFQTLSKLPSEPYDLLIIGGGCSGAGVALEAATRGYKCLLIEAEDFSAGYGLGIF